MNGAEIGGEKISHRQKFSNFTAIISFIFNHLINIAKKKNLPLINQLALGIN